MKGKLQEYSLIAEIIGAVAVVISLLYVGASVKQHTEATLVANHQVLVAMDIDKNAWFKDLAFALVYETALENTDDLSPAQQRQYRAFLADLFNTWEFAFITHSGGMMADNIWNGWDGFYRSGMELQPYRQYWSDAKSGFSVDFASYVDSILPEGE